MRYVVSAVSLGLLALMSPPALAQQQQDTLEADIAQQWQAAQVMQTHTAQAISRLLEDRRKAQATLAAERAWWGAYVKGLYDK